MAVEKMSGVYEIVNLVNGKRYVGSAVDVHQRWREHRKGLRAGKHHSRHLMNAWIKHGSDAFEFRIIHLCHPAGLIREEQAEFDRRRPEYNICQHAGSTLGLRHSAETRAAIGAKLRGSKRDPEVVAAIAAQLRGRKLPPERVAHLVGNSYAKGYRHTDEWKAANSARNTGRKHPKSPEYRQKIAATLRAQCESPEARERLRKQAADAWAARPPEERNAHAAKMRAARGPVTEEQRRAISERQIGRPMYPNAVTALQAANRGRKLSDTHRQKISESSLRAWTPERKAKQAAAIRLHHERKRQAALSD